MFPQLVKDLIIKEHKIGANALLVFNEEFYYRIKSKKVKMRGTLEEFRGI